MTYQALSPDRWRAILSALEARAQTGNLCPRQRDAKTNGLILSNVQENDAHLGVISRSPQHAGTVVFAGCNLRCLGCIYWPWSFEKKGVPKTPEQLAKILVRLQELGRDVIVLMNASHHLPAVVQALQIAATNGLSIPLCYYSTGYEHVETLEVIRPLFAYFVVDFKTADPEFARLYLGAHDYVRVATAVLDWVKANYPPLKVREPRAETGYVVRHLVVPDGGIQALTALRFLMKRLGRTAPVELVGYVPAHKAPHALGGYDRPVTMEKDLVPILQKAVAWGMTNVANP